MKKPKTKMRTTMFILGLSLLAASVVCTPAEAALIELEPDMSQVGTNVTNAIAYFPQWHCCIEFLK